MGVVLAVVTFSLSVPSCGTDAVGVDACRQIENARCQASVACGFTAADVTSCVSFYHDQCLHGLENATAEPAQTNIDLCIAALDAVGTCAAQGDLTMADCTPPVTLNPALDGGLIDTETPCQVLQHEPEDLNDCAFIVEPLDAGTGGGGSGAGGSFIL
jgi:hypothetical protein